MNVYTIAPLIALLAYTPLVITIASSRPWQKRNTQFLFFVAAAMIWSVVDIFLRSDYLPEHKFLFFQLIIVTYMMMAVQFHLFTSSFFGNGYGRWLPFVYASLALVVVLVCLGVVPAGANKINDTTTIDYGYGVIFIFIPLFIVLGRNYYGFIKMIKQNTNPV